MNSRKNPSDHNARASRIEGHNTVRSSQIVRDKPRQGAPYQTSSTANVHEVYQTYIADDNCNKSASNEAYGTAHGSREYPQISTNENSRRGSLNLFLKRFLNKKNEFAWLTQLYNNVGSDHFKKSVIHSTFPVNLNQADFNYFIDMTFNDFSEDLRASIRNLYFEMNGNLTAEDIIITNDEGNAASVTLIQILCQKNDLSELEMLVGVVSLIRRPHIDNPIDQLNWQTHKEQLKNALQYIFAKEAEKELSFK